MRSAFVCSTLVVCARRLGGGSAAESPKNPELKRLHYEVGLRYSDPIGVTHLHCDADDYSVTIDWPDGPEVATKLVTPRADGTTPLGSYGFTSTHVFTKEGETANVTVRNYSGHCRQATSQFTLIADPVSVRVWPRQAVKHLDANVSLPLHPGNTAKLRVTLDKPALRAPGFSSQ